VLEHRSKAPAAFGPDAFCDEGGAILPFDGEIRLK
jgi:hypothetical protein